jgi:hypothetical protein
VDGDPEFDTDSDIYMQEPESADVCGNYEVQNTREEEQGHEDCLVASGDREHHGNDTHLNICARDKAVSTSDDVLPSTLSKSTENNDNTSGAYSITSQETQSHQDDVLNTDLDESRPAEPPCSVLAHFSKGLVFLVSSWFQPKQAQHLEDRRPQGGQNGR